MFKFVQLLFMISMGCTMATEFRRPRVLRVESLQSGPTHEARKLSPQSELRVLTEEDQHLAFRELFSVTEYNSMSFSYNTDTPLVGKPVIAPPTTSPTTAPVSIPSTSSLAPTSLPEATNLEPTPAPVTTTPDLVPPSESNDIEPAQDSGTETLPPTASPTLTGIKAGVQDVNKSSSGPTPGKKVLISVMAAAAAAVLAAIVARKVRYSGRLECADRSFSSESVIIYQDPFEIYKAPNGNLEDVEL